MTNNCMYQKTLLLKLNNRFLVPNQHGSTKHWQAFTMCFRQAFFYLNWLWNVMYDNVRNLVMVKATYDGFQNESEDLLGVIIHSCPHSPSPSIRGSKGIEVQSILLPRYYRDTPQEYKPNHCRISICNCYIGSSEQKLISEQVLDFFPVHISRKHCKNNKSVFCCRYLC